MNKVILIGRLTKDPEIRYTKNQTAVCSFTLAVNRRKQDEADFINCQAWSKTAETITKYVAKGQQIAIVGRIQTRTWEDNEGKKHPVTEVVIDEFYFADSRRGDAYEPQQPSNDDTSNLMCPTCKKPLDQCECLPF